MVAEESVGHSPHSSYCIKHIVTNHNLTNIYFICQFLIVEKVCTLPEHNEK